MIKDNIIREQEEYERSIKNVRIAVAKLRLSQGGIDTENISPQKLDNVVRIFNEIEDLQKDTQRKIADIQKDANAKISQAQQDANVRFGELNTRYQELFSSMKKIDNENIIIGKDVKPEPVQELTSRAIEMEKQDHTEKMPKADEDIPIID